VKAISNLAGILYNQAGTLCLPERDIIARTVVSPSSVKTCRAEGIGRDYFYVGLSYVKYKKMPELVCIYRER
jgi:hypothetical protein